jgi:hypothetical protein
VANLARGSELPDVNSLRLAMAAIRSMAPHDPVETMICALMEAIHRFAMMFAERGANEAFIADIAREQQSLNRLIRTSSSLAAALERHRNTARKTEGPRLSATNGHANGKKFPHAESQINVCLSGREWDTLFGPLVSIGSLPGWSVDMNLYFARAAVKGMAPRDPLEARRCAQAVVAYSGAMIFGNRLLYAEDAVDLELAELCVNRAVRTFCTVVEGIDRQRLAAARNFVRQQTSVDHAKETSANGAVHGNGIKSSDDEHEHA